MNEMKESYRSRRPRVWLAIGLVLCTFGLALPPFAGAEGSRNVYPETATGFRANLEWRTSGYGPTPASSPDPNRGLIPRRTLLKVFLNQGEYVLLGSSAVGVTGTPNNGDIRIYNPGLVTGAIAQELIPATASFSCVAQRATPGNETRGRIGSRVQELAGPNTEDNQIPTGYLPCYYQATTTGIYDIVFLGPEGDGSDAQNLPSGSIDLTDGDLGPGQSTSVAAWDVTVRSSLTSNVELRGRLFTYYFAGFTGANGRPAAGTVFIATMDGFIYKVDYRGDPFGFVLYSNQFGFANSNNLPLYANILADAGGTTKEQNQLLKLQGDVRILLPEYPMFLSPPDPQVLDALNISRTPLVPRLSAFSFTGSRGGNETEIDKGGVFRLTSTRSELIYTIVISRDGTNFDPTNEQNRVLRNRIASSGQVEVIWDGRDNVGNPFPLGTYQAQVQAQGGEVHFPFLDVENNLAGGPTIELANPPGGNCPDWDGGCFGAFYNDRGYQTADGTLVGTSVNGPLCPDSTGNPPTVAFSDPERGFDSRLMQRSYGFTEGGNPPSICTPDSGFGDKKGLDLWTFYPSNRLTTPLLIRQEPTAVTLSSFTAASEPGKVVLRWTTQTELNSWGFHVYRSASGTRADATRITPSLILARGSTQAGASYRWDDSTAQPGTAYTYWLEEIEHGDGSNINIYGPVRSSVGTSNVYQVVVPLVLNAPSPTR